MEDIEVDLASPEFKVDPYPFFARLRETAPACRVTLPGRQAACLITRYDDVAAALKDCRFAKDRNRALTPDQAAALLRRAPGPRLSVRPGELRWRRGLVLRGLESLPVILDGDRLPPRRGASGSPGSCPLNV